MNEQTNLPEVSALSDDELLVRSGRGDLDAMRELARRENPIYKQAFRSACIEVLGEDPDEWDDPYPSDEDET